MGLQYWMKPMLANPGSVEMEFDEDRWVAEGKFDGFRGIIYRTPSGAIELYTGRNAANYSGHLPYLEEVLAEVLPPDTCIDGELMSSRGRAAVQSVMFTQGVHIPSPALPALQLVAFDVLKHNGQDTRRDGWTARRQLLEQIDVGDGTLLKRSLVLPTQSALDIALDAGLEGIVLKRRDSYYFNSRNSNWVKIKFKETSEAKIIGFKPGKAGGALEGMVGAFEVQLLDSGVQTTVKCGTQARHEDATEHPDRWLGAIIEISHNGIQESGVPLHPQFKTRREDREPQASVAGARTGQANGTLSAPPAAGDTQTIRRPPMARTGNWMRNYGQMGDAKLERCITELQRREGDAYDRVLAHDADPDEHLAAAQAALEGRQAPAVN